MSSQRRQTLAPLSPDVFNAMGRMSLAGPARVAEKGGKGKRMTMVGGTQRVERPGTAGTD